MQVWFRFLLVQKWAFAISIFILWKKSCRVKKDFKYTIFLIVHVNKNKILRLNYVWRDWHENKPESAFLLILMSTFNFKT